METIEISGITYEVEKTVTAESCDADGLGNLAAALRENGERQLYVRRPRGSRIYLVRQFTTKHGVATAKPFPIA